MQVWGYLDTKKHAFITKSATAPSDGRTEATEKADLAYIASHLRARTPDEIPAEPGVCLDLGFIADDLGKYQEIFGIGFRFPSLPDVSLSISSNKDGQTPQPLSVRRKEAERSVLGSILEGKFRQVKVLRDGPRKLSDILSLVAENRFQMRVTGLEESRLMENLQKIANRISVGVITAALILASAMMMRVPSSHTLWGYPVVALVLFLLGVALGGGIIVSSLLSDHRARSREERGPR